MHDLRYLNQRFSTLAQEADSMDSDTHRKLVKALCTAGQAVESEEGKLAVYAVTVAACEGSEGLKSFVRMAAEWVLGTREKDAATPRVN